MSEKKEPNKNVKRYVSLKDQKAIKKLVKTDREWGSFNTDIRKINR